MKNIDFTPTAYTVRSPGDGSQVRYEGEQWDWDIRRAKSIYEEFATDYPALAALVVPDHFVQEYCRGCDSASWSGSTFREWNEVFLELANRAIVHSKFN